MEVEGVEHARIGRGYVILLGVRRSDGEETAITLADRCAGLRIFDDAQGKMNCSLQDVGGEALVVSQFTLYADTRRGFRPGFTDAAPPEEAQPLYEKFLDRLRARLGADRVSGGVFGAHMLVTILNDGPVTVLIERPVQKTSMELDV